MRLPNYPVRLFRLSCGCLCSYPVMAASYAHEVLCARCGSAAVTVRAYPEKACGARGSCDGFPLSCTQEHGTCGDWHLDELADAKFTVEGPRLRRGSEGRTGRA